MEFFMKSYNYRKQKIFGIFGAAFFAAVFAFVLSSCGKTQAVKTDTTDVKKDELVIATGKTDTGVFDPKKGWGNHSQSPLTHSMLLRFDANINYIGDLAKSYTVSEDGLKWTFELNDNHKFSNGETVTPSDVKFTYEMLKEDGIAFDLTYVKSIELTGENGITFTLDSPNSDFFAPLLEIGIVPEKYYDDNYSSNPISSGPYMVTQYNAGQQIIFEANPYWHGQELHFKKLTLLLMADDAALAAAKSGAVDLAYVPATFADQSAAGMVMREFESVHARGITMPTNPSGGKGLVNGIEVSTGNDVTSDVAIRRALSYGLDRQAIIDLALQGHGAKSYSVSNGMPWFNEQTIIADGDIDAAKKILEDAGWRDSDNDGIVEKNGLKAEFSLYYNTADKVRENLALAAADLALNIGIKINGVGATWDEIYKQGKSNAILWAGGKPYPAHVYTNYSTAKINQGASNMTEYRNPVVEGYLQKALSAQTQDEINKYLKLAQWDGTTGCSALGDEPVIWLARPNILYLINENLDIGDHPILTASFEWALYRNITEWKWKE
jgi:peptide/nickel transport system substrate-binding protein